MNNTDPVWDFVADISGDKDVGESSRNKGNVSDSMLDPDSIACDFPSWNHIESDSLSIGTFTDEDDHFQNAFEVFSSFQVHPTIQSPRSIEFPKDFELEVDYKGEPASKNKGKSNEVYDLKCLGQEVAGTSQELEIKKQNDQPKPKRYAAVHNMSERRRRERIRGKIQELQELIPNCNKRDKASILDDAINYIKSLKLQVEMMSMARGALFQVPFVPAALLSPYMQMRPAAPWMYFSAGVPAMPLPAPMAAAAGTRLPVVPGTRSLLPLQMPLPVNQSLSALSQAATPTLMHPDFVPGFSPAFNNSMQGETSSKNVPTSSDTDCH